MTVHISLSLSPQIGLMSVTVFPVRLLLVSFLMLLAWPFAFAASLGRSEIVMEPQSWWRRCVLEGYLCVWESVNVCVCVTEPYGITQIV